MSVSVQFDSERRLSGVKRVLEDGSPAPELVADQVKLLPNGGVRATDGKGRFWVGDTAAADEQGWIPLQQAD